MKNFGLNSFLVALDVLFLFSFSPGESEAQYKIPGSVFGEGCAAIADGSYKMAGTVGQSIIGNVSDASDLNGIGFWYLEECLLTGVMSPRDDLPSEYRLAQNYPNPFNPTTTIKYDLPKAGRVTLKIYDILGNEVATIMDGYRTPGSYSISFNASKLASGLYLYRLVAGDYSSVRKMMLVK